MDGWAAADLFAAFHALQCPTHRYSATSSSCAPASSAFSQIGPRNLNSTCQHVCFCMSFGWRGAVLAIGGESNGRAVLQFLTLRDPRAEGHVQSCVQRLD